MRILKHFSLSLTILFLLTLFSLLLKPIAFVLSGGAHLPTPTGAFQVGRSRMMLQDTSRQEMFTLDPNDKRNIVLNIFYPANVEGHKTGAYTEARGFESVDGVPAFLLSPIRTNFAVDAPPANGHFPVLIFAAGFAGPVSYYTSLIEEVTSQGYIVLAVEHPYHFSGVYFNDKVIQGNDAGMCEDNFDTEACKEQVSVVLVEDMRFALDTIQTFNLEHPTLAGHFDFGRVGAFGHSFGGQSLAALALTDHRIKGVINFDGSIVDKRVIKQGVQVPYLHVFDDFEIPSQEVLEKLNMTLADWWEDFAKRNYPPSLQTGDSPFHAVQLIDAKHYSFATDLPHLKPMFPFVINEDLVGKVKAKDALEATAKVTLKFFDSYLNQKELGNEDLAAVHPALRPGFDTLGSRIIVEK